MQAEKSCATMVGDVPGWEKDESGVESLPRDRQEWHSRGPSGVEEIRRAPWRGLRGDRQQWHGQSTAVPVRTTVPPGGYGGEARRSRCSSALPRRRGARTSPGSLAQGGSSPAAASQPLHGPVRGRRRRQAYLHDHACASFARPGRRGGSASAAWVMAQPWTTVAWAPRPARPNNPAASALCRLVCCLRRGRVSLGHRSGASHCVCHRASPQAGSLTPARAAQGHCPGRPRRLGPSRRQCLLRRSGPQALGKTVRTGGRTGAACGA